MMGHRTLLQYIAGFALSRAVEYPIQVLSAFAAAQLPWMSQTPLFRVLLENPRGVMRELWFVYIRDLRDWVFWSIWVGVGLAVSIGVLLSERVNADARKVFRGFYFVIVWLCLYGIHAWQFGWRYEASLLLSFVPLYLLGQFLAGMLLARLLPYLYYFLAETRVEDWLARRRSKA